VFLGGLGVLQTPGKGRFYLVVIDQNIDPPDEREWHFEFQSYSLICGQYTWRTAHGAQHVRTLSGPEYEWPTF